MPLKYYAVKVQLKSQNTAISVLKLAPAQSFLFLSSLYAFVAQPAVHLNLLSLGMC